MTLSYESHGPTAARSAVNKSGPTFYEKYQRHLDFVGLGRSPLLSLRIDTTVLGVLSLCIQ